MEQSTRRRQSEAAAPLDAALATPGTGSALYVINLCASMAPIVHNDRPLPGFENYRLYQVSRKEDGRIRYRLRMGFFGDEAEAETALALVREQYPTAFATSLCDEDQRHTRGFGGTRPAAQSGVAQPPAAKVVQPVQAAEPPLAKPVAAKPTGMSPPAKKIETIAPAAKAQPPAPAASTAKVQPAARVQAAAQAPADVSTSDTQRRPALKAERAAVELEWDDTAVAAPPNASTSAPAAQPAKVQASTSAPVSTPSAVSPKPERPAVELTLAAEPEKPAAPATQAPPATEPFHVGKGVEIPAMSLTLEAEPAAVALAASGSPASTPIAAAPKSGAAAAAKTPTKAATKVAAKPQLNATRQPPPAKPAVNKQTAQPSALPKAPTVLGDDVPRPDLDSTQTIRALTAAELEDENQPKWFAVQLAVSEQTINLDTMPHLDIFSAYRLYSVATAGNGKILHHMRIGFFKEQVSADAVSGYLKTFFANPTVLRISVAEYSRFSQEAQSASPAAAEPKAKVIELASARERAPAREVPVVTMEVVNPSASGRYPQPNTSASGVHKQPATSPAKAAAKSAPPATKRAAPPVKGKGGVSSSGKHRTLNEALLAEAREVALSESAIRRLPKNSSLLSKLFGKK